jgi:hypothetical protein
MTELVGDVLPWSLDGDRREQLLYVLALAAVLAGTVLCLVATRVAALDVLAAAVAAGGAAAWLLANGPAEGAVLLEVLPDNGLTVADLVVVPSVLLVPWLAVRRVLGHRARPPAVHAHARP